MGLKKIKIRVERPLIETDVIIGRRYSFKSKGVSKSHPRIFTIRHLYLNENESFSFLFVEITKKFHQYN